MNTYTHIDYCFQVFEKSTKTTHTLQTTSPARDPPDHGGEQHTETSRPFLHRSRTRTYTSITCFSHLAPLPGHDATLTICNTLTRSHAAQIQLKYRGRKVTSIITQGTHAFHTPC